MTSAGRARCVASKRTLFNAGDIRDLEAGAHYFEAHRGLQMALQIRVQSVRFGFHSTTLLDRGRFQVGNRR